MTATQKRRRTKFSREPAPLYTLRIRYSGGSCGTKPVRFIKVRMDGPKSKRWKLYARHVWEQHRGPVPRGMRVGHLDGNLLDDNISNLALMRPGDVVGLAHIRDPEMSRRNYQAAAKGTAETNRLRGRLNRHFNWLPTYWYAVFPAVGQILNEPRRKAIEVTRLCGVDVDWRWSRSAALGYSGHKLLEACCLLFPGDRSASELLSDVNRLRQFAGWPPVTLPALRSAVSRLRGMGLFDDDTPRGVYRRSGMALLERTRKTPFLTVRGDRLTDPLFAGFCKVESVEGVCLRCGCTENDACCDDQGSCWWIDSGLCSHCETSR